jgi:hypothetical protein
MKISHSKLYQFSILNAYLCGTSEVSKVCQEDADSTHFIGKHRRYDSSMFHPCAGWSWGWAEGQILHQMFALFPFTHEFCTLWLFNIAMV